MNDELAVALFRNDIELYELLGLLKLIGATTEEFQQFLDGARETHGFNAETVDRVRRIWDTGSA